MAIGREQPVAYRAFTAMDPQALLRHVDFCEFPNTDTAQADFVAAERPAVSMDVIDAAVGAVAYEFCTEPYQQGSLPDRPLSTRSLRRGNVTQDR